jgi:hypothetical protein
MARVTCERDGIDLDQASVLRRMRGALPHKALQRTALGAAAERDLVGRTSGEPTW